MYDIYIYICMYIYMYVCIYIYIYVCIYLLFFYVVTLIIKVLNGNCFQQSDLCICATKSKKRN